MSSVTSGTTLVGSLAGDGTRARRGVIPVGDGVTGALACRPGHTGVGDAPVAVAAVCRLRRDLRAGVAGAASSAGLRRDLHGDPYRRPDPWCLFGGGLFAPRGGD